MDINLLKDTTGRESAEKPTPPPAPLQYSAPGREHLNERQGKPPSGFSMWVKNLFKPKAKPPTPFKPERLPSPHLPKPGKHPEPSVFAAPEDIFASVEPSVAPATPPPSHSRPLTPQPPPIESTPPTAPQPRFSVAPPNLASGQFPRAALPQQPRPNGPRLPTASPTPAPFVPTSASQFLVNLLPQEYSVSPGEIKRRALSLGLVFVLAVVAVAATYFLLTLYEHNFLQKTGQVDEQLQQVKSEISELTIVKNDARAFRDRAELFASRLALHVYWTRFFEKVEQYTLKEVTLSNVFHGTTSGGITLDGIAPTIEDVARQLAVLAKATDFLIGAQLTAVNTAEVKTVSGTAIQTGGYHFSISGTLNPLLFFSLLTPAKAGEAAPSATPSASGPSAGGTL